MTECQIAPGCARAPSSREQAAHHGGTGVRDRPACGHRARPARAVPPRNRCSPTISPSGSPGDGIIAATRTISSTGARSHASGAVNPPSEWATRTTSLRFPMAFTTASAFRVTSIRAREALISATLTCVRRRVGSAISQPRGDGTGGGPESVPGARGYGSTSASRMPRRRSWLRRRNSARSFCFASSMQSKGPGA